MSDRYSRLFAEYAESVTYNDLSANTIHQVKRRIVDSIGVAMAGFPEDAPMAVRAFAEDLSNVKGATIWGTGFKAFPDVAALSNGVALRYLDFNDTYLSKEPLHPSDMITGLVALCEWGGLPLKDFITAVSVGYEVAVNLCDSNSLRSHGWDHVNYIAIGEACAAGKLLNLSIKEIENAISISTIPHAAMRQTRSGELSMWKGAAAANSVRNAIVSVLLARKGLTGPNHPFDGEMGIFRQLLGGESFDDFYLDTLEKKNPPTRIQDTYIKFWPVEYHAQSAVDAALQIYKELKDPSRIKSVHLDTFKASYEIIAKDPEKWAPKTRETADHSIQYIVCAALLDGAVDKNTFDLARISGQDIKNLMKRTTLREDDELTRGYPDGIPNRITVNTNDGNIITKEVRYPRGHPKNAISDKELEQKFYSNVDWCWSRRQSQDVLEFLWGIEQKESLDLLMQSMLIQKQ